MESLVVIPAVEAKAIFRSKVDEDRHNFIESYKEWRLASERGTNYSDIQQKWNEYVNFRDLWANSHTVYKRY